MTLILDAGAFFAVERRDYEISARIKRERLAGRSPRTHGGVIGQVWRGGTGRNTLVARLLPSLDIVGLDGELGKRAGELLARSNSSDVIDAAVVLLARPGDRILTSDPHDLAELATAADVDVEIVSV
ncbi:MAG: twitching motility protein PilT [Acidimicrobiales bacterium]|nr:MAG: twitching motility protein PilT [Acidimicrobiales bacterium]